MKSISTMEENIGNKYFLLNQECYFVKGAKRGAIYNLKTGRIISLDEYLSITIELCENGNKIMDVFKSISTENKIIDLLIKDLYGIEELKCGSFYDNYFIIDKIKPTFMDRQLSLRGLEKYETVFLELTSLCNLNCSYCYPYTYKTNRSTSCKRWPRSKKETTLNQNEWEKIISDCAIFNCSKIIFIGGEPLLKYNLLKYLIEYSKNSGINDIILYTNGLLLNNNNIKYFKEHNVHLIVQTYSDKKNIFDKISGINGTYDILIENLKLLSKMECNYSINIILFNKYNKYINNIIKHYNVYNPNNINVIYVYPKNISLNTINKYRYLFKLNNKDLQKDKITNSIFFKNCQSNSCWNYKVAITEYGDILPCIMARKQIIGKINNMNIREVFNLENKFRYWKLSRDYINDCFEWSQCKF